MCVHSRWLCNTWSDSVIILQTVIVDVIPGCWCSWWRGRPLRMNYAKGRFFFPVAGLTTVTSHHYLSGYQPGFLWSHRWMETVGHNHLPFNASTMRRHKVRINWKFRISQIYLHCYRLVTMLRWEVVSKTSNRSSTSTHILKPWGILVSRTSCLWRQRGLWLLSLLHHMESIYVCTYDFRPDCATFHNRQMF